MNPRNRRLLNLLFLTAAALYPCLGASALTPAALQPYPVSAAQATGGEASAFVRQVVAILTKRVGLTEAQQAEVTATVSAERPGIEPLVRQLITAQEQLRSLYADGRIDEQDEALARTILLGQRHTLAELLFVEIRVARQIYTLLTPAQRDLLGQERGRIEEEIAGLFYFAGIGGSLQETFSLLAARLNLSAEQNFRILLIIAAEAPTIDALSRQFTANQEALWEAVRAGQFDEPAARELAAQQGQVLADLLAGVEIVLLRLYGVLTPDQRAVIEQERDAFEARLRGLFSFFSIDEPRAFVRQQYLDFLNRDPDDAGLDFWTNQITSCGGGAGCVDNRRQHVSAAFFLSVEFQQTGYLVYKAYGAAFGTRRVGNAVPLTLQEFLPDTQRIGGGVVVNQGDWQAQLEANKVAYFNEFVSRQQFLALYPSSMGAVQLVDALNANSNSSLSQAQRDDLVNKLGAGQLNRAQVLRAVAENAAFDAAEKNRAFVLMQYFGYLRRNPNDAPELNLDFGGYNFWLQKLNDHNGDFIAAEMVRSFLVSGEYRGRFGQ